MDKKVLKSILGRLRNISCDVVRIQTLMETHGDEEPSEFEMELVELVGKISDYEHEAFEKCYNELNKKCHMD